MSEVTQKKPIYKKWWFWLLASFVFIIILSASSGDGTTDQETPEARQIVDAPHLLSLTIDEVREELGAPEDGDTTDPTEEQLRLGTKEWTNQYTVEGHTIVLDFDVNSREVTGFFIATDVVDIQGTKDWRVLLPISNLSENSDDYSIDPVETLKYPGFYTGVQASE